MCSLTGHEIKVLGETELIEDNGVIKVIVVDGLPHSGILGIDTLGKYSVVNFAIETLTWRDNTYTLKTCNTVTHVASLCSPQPVMKGAHIEAMVRKYDYLFAAKGEKIGKHPGIAVNIVTDGTIIKMRPYHTPLTKRKRVEKLVDEMLEDGVIGPSSSPYASACLLVDKKCGGLFEVECCHKERFIHNSSYTRHL